MKRVPFIVASGLLRDKVIYQAEVSHNEKKEPTSIHLELSDGIQFVIRAPDDNPIQFLSSEG